MLFAGLSLAMLAGAALAQSADDLVTVLNSTDGASAVAKVVSETPGFLDAIAGKTNLTFVAPNNTAVAQFANSTLGQDASDDYILNLLLYHVINGGYNNITDYYVDHTLLTSSNYTTVTDGAFIGIYYDDDENVIGFYGGDDYNPEGAPTPIPFSQGWIYVVNGVLNIPSTVSETIVYGDFNGSSFDAALEKTGLTEEIDSLHDATYFVPVNDGFAAVNASLAALDTDQLAELLKYHVVAGKVWHFDDFVNGSQLTTLQDWFVNNAGVSYVDLATSEGVVIFIDNVLNPNASWTPAANGTEDGVAAWPTSSSSGGSSTTSSVPAATFTGAAAPLRSGAVGVAALLGAGAALAFVF